MKKRLTMTSASSYNLSRWPVLIMKSIKLKDKMPSSKILTRILQQETFMSRTTKSLLFLQILNLKQTMAKKNNN